MFRWIPTVLLVRIFSSSLPIRIFKLYASFLITLHSSVQPRTSPSYVANNGRNNCFGGDTVVKKCIIKFWRHSIAQIRICSRETMFLARVTFWLSSRFTGCQRLYCVIQTVIQYSRLHLRFEIYFRFYRWLLSAVLIISVITQFVPM